MFPWMICVCHHNKSHQNSSPLLIWPSKSRCYHLHNKFCGILYGDRVTKFLDFFFLDLLKTSDVLKKPLTLKWDEFILTLPGLSMLLGSPFIIPLGLLVLSCKVVDRNLCHFAWGFKSDIFQLSRWFVLPKKKTNMHSFYFYQFPNTPVSEPVVLSCPPGLESTIYSPVFSVLYLATPIISSFSLFLSPVMLFCFLTWHRSKLSWKNFILPFAL